jgi:hypothetical protein
MLYIKQSKSVEASCIYITIKAFYKKVFSVQNIKILSSWLLQNGIRDVVHGNTLLPMLPYEVVD